MTRRAWRARAVALSSVAVLFLLAGCGDEEAPVRSGAAVGPDRSLPPDTQPGWAGLADDAHGEFATQGSAAFDREELVVLGNYDRSTGRVRLDNGPFAFSPDTGSWRRLPALPFDHPIVGGGLTRASFGLVLVGVACATDSPGFDPVDTDDELECDPGTWSVAIKANGSDEFRPVELPESIAPRGQLRALASVDQPDAWLTGTAGAYRLGADGTVTELVASGEGGLWCDAAGTLFGTVAIGDPPAGMPQQAQLAVLDEGRWRPLDVGATGALSQTDCIGDRALLHTVNEEPAVDEWHLLGPGGETLPFEPPPEDLGVLWSDGAHLVGQAIGSPAEGMPGTFARKVWALQPDGTWAQPVPPLLEILNEILPLDDTTALYVWSSYDPDNLAASTLTYEVVPLDP